MLGSVLYNGVSISQTPTSCVTMANEFLLNDSQSGTVARLRGSVTLNDLWALNS
jgi:hypothetical protein